MRITSRKQVRDAVVALLAPTPSTGTWGYVHPSRVASNQVKWPYLMVFSDGEAAERTTMGEPCMYDRVCTINVIGMLKMPGNQDFITIEDQMDAMADEIESKLTNALIRSSLVHIGWLVLKETQMQVIVKDDDTISHAEVTQTWMASYATTEGVPDTMI